MKKIIDFKLIAVLLFSFSFYACGDDNEDMLINAESDDSSITETSTNDSPLTETSPDNPSMTQTSTNDSSLTETLPSVPPLNETTIWSGRKLKFLKTYHDDPTSSEAQDRISDKVWITRGNGTELIYNAVLENSANEDISPAGTLWAKGTTADLQNLTFGSFKTIFFDPYRQVHVPLVLLLVEENIAIDIEFNIWDQFYGGVSYERKTP